MLSNPAYSFAAEDTHHPSLPTMASAAADKALKRIKDFSVRRPNTECFVCASRVRRAYVGGWCNLWPCPGRSSQAPGRQ